MITKFDNFNINEALNAVDVAEITVCYITSSIADKNLAGKVIENIRNEIAYALGDEFADKYEVKKQKIQTTLHCTEISMTINLPATYISRDSIRRARIQDLRSAVNNAGNMLSVNVFLTTNDGHLEI
ncbi:MAG: hypothetical protein IKO36_12750 [Bacteroidaceae bacterium]|nr:hypothetical protein [Bacteroidaceae bacterium]